MLSASRIVDTKGVPVRNSYRNSNAHFVRVSEDRKSDLACPKAIERRGKAKSDPKCPQNLKDKLKKFKSSF